ncbi:PP2C family protein-serine/threonine phosphatase [Nakamurella endophytica]|uniref:PPM-type phosphatase domain-containing protein n=1 Tax=Nakamurella endophytica TaxID=1748367 RepID=A0A917SWT3_9ACTN|nr:PP2C family serine/threonine-protein phosphatase [Nakamurella endophytica]GGM00168.1 hypothetical protein GCM10011594_20320 [Nakamurella endophytica]
MTHRIRYAARTDRGLLRANNQDSVFAGDRLLVIADGMGGHAAGDVASRLVVSAFAPLDELPLGTDMRGPLVAATREGNQAIADTVQESPELDGMGTTLTALLFDGPTVALAHVGDSRAYLYRNGVLHQITHDDTFVQSLVDEGRITPDEAAHHPQRSLLLRALNGSEMDPAIVLREVSPGDRFLICSDGLSDYVSPEAIADALAGPDPDQVADTLIQLALVAGGPDNVTVVVADVLDVGRTGPAAVAAAGVSDDPDATGPMQPITMTQRMPRVPLPPIPEDVPARPEYIVDGGGDSGYDTDFDTDEYDGEFDDGEFDDEDYDGPDYAGPDWDGAAGGTAGPGDRTPPGARPADRRVSAPGRRGRWGRRTALALALVVLLGVGLTGSWIWARTNYYVGAEAGRVVVYRGVDGSLLGLRLASVLEDACVTGAATGCRPLRVDDLQQAARDQVNSGINVDGLDGARDVIQRLRDTGLLPLCAGSAPSTSATTSRSGSTGPSTASGSGPSTAGTTATSGSTGSGSTGSGGPGSGSSGSSTATAAPTASGSGRPSGPAPTPVTVTTVTTVTRGVAASETAPPALTPQPQLAAPAPATPVTPGTSRTSAAARTPARGTATTGPRATGPRGTATAGRPTGTGPGTARPPARTTPPRSTPARTSPARSTPARTTATRTTPPRTTPTVTVTSTATVTPTPTPSTTLTNAPQVPGVNCREAG